MSIIDNTSYGSLSSKAQEAYLKDASNPEGLLRIIGTIAGLQENKQSLIAQMGEDAYTKRVEEYFGKKYKKTEDYKGGKLNDWLELYICKIMGLDKSQVKTFRNMILSDKNGSTLETLLALIGPIAKQLYWTMPAGKRATVDQAMAMPTYKNKWGIDFAKKNN